VDRAIIGTTRRVNEACGTIDWVRTQTEHAHSPSPGKESIIFRVHPEKEDGKMVYQIGTADPERAVEAAHQVAADVNEINVNAGCPKPFSTLGGMGAALLKTPDKLCAILEALVKEIMPKYEVSISVKIRILDTAAETKELVTKLCATGITGLTVHCRTTPMRPRQKAIRGQLRMVAEVCHEAGVACYMNGDVENRDQGVALAQEFGADGAMIATAAETNPSVFRSEAEGGALPWKEVVEEYIKTCMSVENKYGNTKYLLAQMIPGKEAAYKKMTPCKKYEELCEALGFDHLLQDAREVDSMIGLDAPPPSKKDKKRANASARAAAGQMDRETPKKSLSERNIKSPKEPEPTPVALAG
jgi:tRNA-dihydrouridine synthase 2